MDFCIECRWAGDGVLARVDFQSGGIVNKCCDFTRLNVIVSFSRKMGEWVALRILLSVGHYWVII